MSVFFYGCVTLDGYLADKNHGLSWLHETGSPEETDCDHFYQAMDVAIMGKRTFEEIARLEDAASVYPTTKNYVFTHADSLPQKGFIPVKGEVTAFVAGLEPDQNIWIIGGNTILAPLLEQDMVDHLIIQVAPVLLGEGIPLFTQREGLKRFHLDEVKQYGQFAELIYSNQHINSNGMPLLKLVSLSKELDKELKRREPSERSHRKVVGTAVMHSELFLKVRQREERVERIKAFLVFPVAAFYLAIMSGRVRTDELMLDTQLSGGFLKKGWDVSFAVGKTVSKFKTVVSLDTFHMDPLTGIPLHQPFQEVSGGIGGLLGISCQETKPGELVNGSILEQA